MQRIQKQLLSYPRFNKRKFKIHLPGEVIRFPSEGKKLSAFCERLVGTNWRSCSAVIIGSNFLKGTQQRLSLLFPEFAASLLGSAAAHRPASASLRAIRSLPCSSLCDGRVYV